MRVNVYHDFASGVRDDRPGLDSCLRALRKGDVLVVWKLDRLGRNLAHLVNTVQDLSARGVGLRVLAGQGAQIDTTTAAGRLVFGIFAALAEFRWTQSRWSATGFMGNGITNCYPDEVGKFISITVLTTERRTRSRSTKLNAS